MIKDIEAQVNLLTLPQAHDHWQQHPVTGLAHHRSYAPALLDQLREALDGAGSGGYGRGGSEKRTRSILDSAGVKLMHDIRLETHEMLIEMEGLQYTDQPTGEVKEELRRWFRLYSKYVRAGTPLAIPSRMRQQLNKLRTWVHTIEQMFNPLRKIELTISCPNSWLVEDEVVYCGQRYWTNDMGDRESSLVAVVREDETVSVFCRSCRGTWSGAFEISLLGIAYTMTKGSI